jgi:pilus assembly protein Flp/PilA
LRTLYGIERLTSRERVVWITIVKKLLVRFLKDTSAATAIEYGLIAAGISIAIISVVNGLGTKLKTTFSSISTQLR